LLLLQRICSKREHVAKSLGFRAQCSGNEQQKLCGKARTPFTSGNGPDVENKQATFKRLFSISAGEIRIRPPVAREGRRGWASSADPAVSM
jgi:hypothetical protein